MLLDKLYPYQKTNAETLASLGFGADLSSTGVGKSLTFMGISMLIGADVVLLVVPLSVSAQWEKTLNKFMPEVRVFRAVKRDKINRYHTYDLFKNCQSSPKALILTYESVRIDCDYLMEILDSII